MGLEDISKQDLFYQISLAFCADGKISANEFNLLKNLSSLIDIGSKEANEIANNAVKKFKSGEHKKAMDLTPDELYQATLMNFSADGIIDENEDKILQELKNLLGAKPEKFVAVEKDYYADKKIRLKPLTCKNCQGLVPFQEKEWITCPYCSKKIDIPQTYLDTVVARKALKTKKTEIDKFIENLKPPTKFESMISSIPDPILLGIFTLVFMFSYNIFAAIPFYQISYLAKTFYKVNLVELVPLNSFNYFLIKFVFYYVLFILPFVFVYLTKRKIMALSEIEYALNAKAPTLTGKVPVCNHCGGALTVCKDSFSVKCIYCETVNIINLRKKQVGMTKATFTNVSADLVAASNQYKSGGKRLIKAIFAFNVVFIIFGLLLWSTNSEPETNEILPLNGTKAAELKSLVHTSGRRFAFDKWETLNAKELTRNKRRSKVILYFFMNAEETAKFEWQPFPKLVKKMIAQAKNPHYVVDEKIQVSIYLDRNYSKNGRLSHKLLFSTDVKMNTKISFQAPLTACYKLELSFPRLRNLFSDRDYIRIETFQLLFSTPEKAKPQL